MYINEWQNKASIDYFIMFIRAWIPYNAWYMEHYYDELANRTSDNAILYYLGTNDNHIRSRIIALLRNNDADACWFKQTLANMHRELLGHHLPAGSNPLSLDSICLNPRSGCLTEIVSFGAYDIKCVNDRTQRRGTRRVKCEVISRKTSLTKYLIEQFEWDITELQRLPDYTNISNDALKHKILEVYQQVNPRKPTIITKEPELRRGEVREPRHSIKLGEENPIYVTDDVMTVAAVVIFLLYELRCKLFHGEIDPMATYDKVYQYAYEIQMMLNKELTI